MLVTVVIPTYNRRQVLAPAIDSALAQVGVDVDVIVVDDGSTDGTVEWVQQQWAGRAVQVLHNTGRKGPAGGRNTGLQAARGDCVALLDSDDRFLPGHLAAAVDVMERHRGVGVVFGRARYLQGGVAVDYMGPNFMRKLGLAPKTAEDDEVAVFGPGFFDHLLEQGCWFNLSSVVLSKTAAQQRMREDLRVAEDYEYWVRLSRSHGFACLKREQIEYTLGDDNISFEADGNVEGHAQQLVRAWGLIGGLPGLTPAQRRLVSHRLAQVHMDWAWRARERGMHLEAARQHVRAMRHGRYFENVTSLAKLVPLALGLH